MSYFNRYVSRVNENGSTPREQFVNDFREIIAESFDISPSYEEVYINGSTTKTSCWIVDNSETKDTKDLLTQYDTPFYAGDIINWDNEDWMVTVKDYKTNVYHKGIISKCISILKWQNESLQIKCALFTYRNDDLTNFGIEDGKIINLGNERRHIYIPSNEDTKKIRKDKRFIIDERAWKVISVDRLKKGLVYLVLQEDTININDRLDLGVADYVQSNFSITILNGNLIETKLDEPIQIQVQVKNGDRIIDNPQVAYSVSDETIATIDENGLLFPVSLGQIEVVVQFENVSASVTVNIVETPQDNKTVEINGSDTIKFNQTQTYTCEFKNNGIPYVDEGIFSITAEDGVSPTSLVTIQSQENNSCTIKAGSTKGYVRLYVKNSDETVIGSKRIEVKSLF